MPVLVLVGLTKATGIAIDTDGMSRIDFFTPGVLALAIMTSSFTSQAIASAFDRRNGVLRLLSTTPLGRGGLLAGKILGVLAVEVVQVVVIATTALLLGWHAGHDRAAARGGRRSSSVPRRSRRSRCSSPGRCAPRPSSPSRTCCSCCSPWPVA